MEKEQINELSSILIGYAIKVHRRLEPGFIEKIYVRALAYEFEKNHIRFAQERSIDVEYEELLLGRHRLDFLIENEVILEIKAVYWINNFHLAQALSYLKAIGKKLALILNFSKIKLQVRRVVCDL